MFSNPYQRQIANRKMSHRGLTRTIQLAVTAGKDAVDFYQALANSCQTQAVRVMFQDTVCKAKNQTGDYQRLLNLLNPERIAV